MMFDPYDSIDMRCVRCQQAPDVISEYIDAARNDSEDGILTSPKGYVAENDGTYNPANGHFYCTDCYIKAGMPLGVAP